MQVKVIDIFRRYRYELIALCSGAAVLTLELVGARVMAPYVGTSIYVWTAMIGVILGALALGSWLGGRLADKQASDGQLAVIISLAASLLLAGLLLQDTVLVTIAGSDADLRIQAITAALLLFAPPAAFLGVLAPYLAKLRLKSLATAGRTFGRLDAATTTGSIIGTFLTGYWLIGWFGNWTIGVLLVVVLFLLSFVANHRLWRWQRLAAVAGAILCFYLPGGISGALIDVDSAYNRYVVSESMQDGRLTHNLQTDFYSIQSAQYVGNPKELPLHYTQRFFEVATVGYDEPKVLLIGGGTYTFATALAGWCETCRVDVVEIDPKLSELAKKYFAYKPSSKVRIIHEDGRTFLNKRTGSYDIVFLDAYSSLAPPYQLTTVQALEQAKAKLKPGGVVVSNIVARYTGNNEFLQAMIRTNSTVFEHIRLHAAKVAFDPHARENFLLVASDEVDAVLRSSNVITTSPVPLLSGGKLLTDDHAPIEQLIN